VGYSADKGRGGRFCKVQLNGALAQAGNRDIKFLIYWYNSTKESNKLPTQNRRFDQRNITNLVT